MSKEQTIDKIIRSVFLVWVAFVPLALNPFGFQYGTLIKVALFRWAVLLVVGLWAFKSLSSGRVVINISPIFRPLVVFFLVNILATWQSISPTTSFFGWFGRYDGLVSLITYVLAVLIASTFFSRSQDRELLLKVILVSALVTIVFALFEFFGMSMGIGTPGRLGSTFGNPGYYAGWLLFVVGASAVFAFSRSDHAKFGWLATIVFIVGSLIIVLTASRIAALALIVVMVLVMSKKYGLKKALSFTVATVMVLGLILALIGWSLPGLTVSRLVKSPTENMGPRVFFWRTAAKAISKRPVLGFGPDTFALVYPSVRSSDWLDADVERGPVDKTHNDLLQVGVTTGLLGLAAYLWVILRFLKYYFQPDKDKNTIRSAFAIGAIGHLIWLQGYFSVAELAPYFWIFMALSMPGSDQSSLYSLEIRPKSPAAGLPLKVVAVGCISAIVFLGSARVMLEQSADIHFGRGLSMSVSTQLPGIADEFNQAVRLNPDEIRYKIYQARALTDLSGRREQPKLIDRAITILRSATRQAPTYGDTWLYLGDTYLDRYKQLGQKSDWESAVKAYRLAGDVLVNSPAVENRLGRAYRQAGKAEQAAIHLRQAIDLDKRDFHLYDDLIKLYRQQPSLGDYRRVETDKQDMAIQDIRSVI